MKIRMIIIINTWFYSHLVCDYRPCLIKISCLIGITCHFNQTDLTSRQRLAAVWWKLPAVGLQLPVWLLPETFLSKHLGAFERLKRAPSLRATRRDAEIFFSVGVICVFTRSIIDSGCLFCLRIIITEMFHVTFSMSVFSFVCTRR